MKSYNRVFAVFMITALVMTVSITAYATYRTVTFDEFSVYLPANSGDAEVSTVAKADDYISFYILPKSEDCTTVRA